MSFFLYLHSPRGLIITRCPPSFHRLVFYLISVVVNSKEISKFHPSVRYRWLREMLFICWHHFFYLFLTSRLIRYLKIRSRKSKKKEQGDGMLSMRARPPSEAEYIDIFQKFKLSFNLLVSGFLRLHWNWIFKWKFLIEKQAKLKSHIHDPNAPELVHFLFSPLTLIAEASHESKSPNLPARVVAPLLTYDAIELLSNCLSSKETELWHSLGDAWHTPKYVFFPSLKSHDANFIMSCDW